MNKRSIQLITKPDFDVPGYIGGLASLTQYKKDFEPKSTEAGLKIMRALYDMGHTSLFECADFGFIFGSTSRVFLAQITRHRVASYTSGSQQYQDHTNFPYVIPESIEAHPNALGVYQDIMEKINGTYELLKHYVGKDDARYVLPGGASNHLYAKFNLREIVCAIMPQRICRRNTPESRNNVQLMVQQMCKAGFEDCVKFGGCACVTEGKCDQGKMRCKEGAFSSWDEMVYGP